MSRKIRGFKPSVEKTDFLLKNFVGKIFYLLLRPMKIVPLRLLTLLALVFPIAEALAEAPPPPSLPPPPPPGLPVDGWVGIALVIALSYGLYTIYINSKKNPVK